MNRRHFVMSSAVAAGATFTSRNLVAASDKVRVAVVGLRGQGNSHIRAYQSMPNVEIAALVDIDESILDKRLGEVEKATARSPSAYVDIRKMLEDKNIDAVSIATPNHNHALQTIWALQAGKHVYCEKPQTHNIFESKQIVAAARKYGKIVQGGVNARSHGGPHGSRREDARGLDRRRLHGSRSLLQAPRHDRPRQAGAGSRRRPLRSVARPAPKSEFTKNRFHYTWHWFWDYGNGDFGNQGIHELDIARWGLGVKYPTKISAIGGHFMFDDDQETPNTLNVAYEFNEPAARRR